MCQNFKAAPCLRSGLHSKLSESVTICCTLHLFSVCRTPGVRQKHKSTNRLTRKLTSCLNQVWNLFHFMILRNCNSLVLCFQLRMSGSWMCAKIIPATTLLTSSASCRRHSSPSVTSQYAVPLYTHLIMNRKYMPMYIVLRVFTAFHSTLFILL